MREAVAPQRAKLQGQGIQIHISRQDSVSRGPDGVPHRAHPLGGRRLYAISLFLRM